METPLVKNSVEIIRDIASALRITGYYELADALNKVTTYNIFECNNILAIIKSKL